ncbi:MULTISPECIES: hypothetical protein [Nocardia]|uniref:hypothetical protein n=1 Tax=Nocardia TaxID=1817 RepID=UPI000D68E3D1|nr:MULTISPECIES: hypothetical protein [Nocardia]
MTTFTPPKALAELVDAALSHGRSFIVQHGVDSGDSPFVSIAVKWLPEGCGVPTEIRMTWHTRATGTYRLFSGIACGIYRDWHDVTVKRAMELVTGADCFHLPRAA